MQKLLFILVLFSLSFGPANAQKKGKPNLKQYKETEKKAKKGEIPAILSIASVCRGHFLEKDEYRDFEQAEEWYAKIPAEDDIKGLVPFNRFVIFLNGGFGIEASAEKAKMYFEEAVNRSDYSRVYTDAPNLHLRDFYDLQADAAGNPAKKLQLARQYFDFEISYEKAVLLLDELIEAKSEEHDARFYKELWHAQLKRYHSYAQTKLPELIYFDILRKHSKKGSSAASLLLVQASENSNSQDYRLSSEEREEILNRIADPNPEIQFKKLCLLQKYQKGPARYISLRRAAALPHGLSEKETAFAEELMQEFRAFDKQITDLAGLEKFAKSDDNFALHPDFNALRNGFYDRPGDLAEFSRRIQNNEIRSLAGPDNFGNYETEVFNLLKQMPARLAGKPLPLMELRDLLVTNEHFRMRSAALKTETDTLLARAGMNETNRSVYEEMYRFSKTKVQTLGAGFDAYRAAVARQSNAPGVAEAEKMYIRFIQEKTVRDLLGEQPGPAEIQAARPWLMDTYWLQPVGENMYFHYTSDSNNWFSGKIMNKGRLYYYQIQRNSNSEKYKLNISQVQGNNTYLVYSSLIQASELNAAHEYVVKVYDAIYGAYHWVPSDSDYLQINYPASGSKIKPASTGRLNRLADKSHGLSEDVLEAKAGPGDFSEKTAIRSAVRYFILEYNRAMK